MSASDVWCRVTVVRPGGSARSTFLVRGRGAPDLGVVDRLARLQLSVVRRGDTMVLSDIADPLAELLDLVGLRRKMSGQAERREDPPHVEERVDGGDPVG